MNNRIYTQRLLRFANRLNSIERMSEPLIREVEIDWVKDHVKVWYRVSYNKKYFWELPVVFDEWTYIEGYSDIGLKEFPSLEVAGSCLVFFNLHPREFTHLFDVDGYQNIKEFGGKQLHEYSLATDVAFNIIQFIDNTRKPNEST